MPTIRKLRRTGTSRAVSMPLGLLNLQEGKHGQLIAVIMITPIQPTKKKLKVQPSERLALWVKFAAVLTLSLTAVEIAHLVLLHTWNSEVFASITGLAGTVTGILISQKT